MADLWLGGVKECEGRLLIPMSKPNCILIGTSENLLKRGVLRRKECHALAIKGVLMINRSDDDAGLCVVSDRAAKCTPVLAPLTGRSVVASPDTIPGETVILSGFCQSWAGVTVSEQVTRGTACIGSGGAVARAVGLRAIAAEDTSRGLGGVDLVIVVTMVAKGTISICIPRCKGRTGIRM